MVKCSSKSELLPFLEELPWVMDRKQTRSPQRLIVHCLAPGKGMSFIPFTESISESLCPLRLWQAVLGVLGQVWGAVGATLCSCHGGWAQPPPIMPVVTQRVLEARGPSRPAGWWVQVRTFRPRGTPCTILPSMAVNNSLQLSTTCDISATAGMLLVYVVSSLCPSRFGVSRDWSQRESDGLNPTSVLCCAVLCLTPSGHRWWESSET